MSEIRYAQVKEWPYPVHYGKENEVSADVLIIGGGVAGCHSAINAAKRGAKVVVVDKGAVIRSGSAGAGIDHWHDACTNPCCRVTPEEMVESGAAQSFGLAGYITCKESYETLLDVEEMGVGIRDVDDEFAGADFRDEKTRLMFAYDYVNKHIIRLRGGANMKPALYNELERLNAETYEHIMVTSLLTEGSKTGSRVVGATGVNIRTGEFYIFKAKATVLSTSQSSGLWVFSTELVGSNTELFDPNCTGDGHAMAWEAGAEFTLVERSGPSMGIFHYPAYGTGNAHNTWYACTIVDATGKEIPWVDRDGRVLKTVSERYQPAPGQKLFTHAAIIANIPYEVRGPSLIPDLAQRIKKGEYVLPFYADLPGMPEHERRAIFGLMVGNEGKTRIPIYETYTRAGFDPDKDMLQTNVLPPEKAGSYEPWWCMHSGGTGPPQWREGGGGIVVVDWDLKTNLKGLYAAGHVGGGFGCATASSTGRYSGRKAAAYARTAAEPVINRKQVEEEKARVYAPISRDGGIGWKELQAGLCRIMQDYCGEYKSEETLKMGLKWLNSIRESEAARAYARNPHELKRTLECLSHITVGEMIMHASLARKASSKAEVWGADFKRIDYPEMDPPEWNKFVTIRLENGEVKVGELPFRYWLLPPNAPTYEENYDRHCGL